MNLDMESSFSLISFTCSWSICYIETSKAVKVVRSCHEMRLPPKVTAVQSLSEDSKL